MKTDFDGLYGKTIAACRGEIQPGVSKTDVNRRAAKTIVRIIVSALQDAMKYELVGGRELINFDQPERIKILAARLSPEQAAEKVFEASRSIHLIDCSVNERLIFEQLLLNLTTSDKMPV